MAASAGTAKGAVCFAAAVQSAAASLATRQTLTVAAALTGAATGIVAGKFAIGIFVAQIVAVATFAGAPALRLTLAQPRAVAVLTRHQAVIGSRTGVVVIPFVHILSGILLMVGTIFFTLRATAGGEHSQECKDNEYGRSRSEHGLGNQ